MSDEKTIFRGGSTGRIRTEISERSKYKRMVDYEGMIDTLYEKYSYGFINPNYQPVFLVDDPEIFKGFPGYADDVRCLSFVADAFSAFRKDYLAIIENTTIGFPEFLDGCTPVLGYESYESIYNDYITYVGVKYSNLLKNNRSVNDYNCYLDALKHLLLRHLKEFPITKSGVLLSNHNHTRSSGLVLEMAKLDYNSDLEKGKILQDENFQCFLQYASNYGFFIDKYAPWRLYANMQHPNIKLYLRRDVPETQKESLTSYDTNYIMDSIYRLKSHRDDLWALQDFTLKVYNDIRNQVPFYVRKEYNSSTAAIEQINVFRPGADMLKTEDWLELLVFVRMLELNIYNDREFRIHKENVLMQNKVYGLEQAIDTVGHIMSNYIRNIYEKYSEGSPNS